MNRRLSRLGWLLALVAFAPGPGPKSKSAPDPDIGRSYQVPYRLTDTNHFLVRVRVNGKGPFNFLVDTGAPALIIATGTAKKVGLVSPEDDFWTPVARLEFEGGAALTRLKARVEDPVQLIGMNALGLPGASIDGILGFTVLARFRLEIDPTRDRMVWTRLDYAPADPPAPRQRDPGPPPAELQLMNALGPLTKAAAFLTGGKQPEETLHPRGFLGLTLEEKNGSVVVAGVLGNSPAARGGVEPGDALIQLRGKTVTSLKTAHEAAAATRPGDRVALTVHRAGATRELSLTAGDGF